MPSLNDVDKAIIKSIFINKDVRSIIVPKMEVKWFRHSTNMQTITKTIKDYVNQWGIDSITPSSIGNEINNKAPLSFDDFKSCIEFDFDSSSEYWLKQVEQYIKYKLVSDVGSKIESDNFDQIINTSYIQDLAEAESFTFNTTIGIDYANSCDLIHDEIIKNEKLFPTGLVCLDNLLNNGFVAPSLNLFLCPTNVGKTLIMSALAKNMAVMGKRVLYITFEDGEAAIAKRITQNLMDASGNELKALPKSTFVDRFNKEVAPILGSSGKLMIKEFPEYTLNSIQLEQLIKDYKTKQKFDPEIIFVDYIACMTPNAGFSAKDNTNTNLARISSEIRAVSMKLKIPIVSGAQSNRSGLESGSELGITNMADSIGSGFKADVIIGVTQTEEEQKSGLYCVKMLKTRRAGNKNATVYMGCNIEKQKIFDVGDTTPKIPTKGNEMTKETNLNDYVGFKTNVENTTASNVVSQVADWD